MRVGRRIAETDPDARPLFIVNLSGRGDKDVDTAMSWFGLDGSADAITGGKA
jgi:tryptophan synthase beta chain